MSLTRSTTGSWVLLPVCLFILAGCGVDTEPSTGGSLTVATSTPSSSRSDPALTLESVDASVQKLIAEKYPELQQVSDEAFDGAADDSSIDQSRFMPRLNGNLTHKCWKKPAGGVTCLGWYDWPAEAAEPDLTCEGGTQLYYHRGVNHNVAKRTYDAQYRLTQRIQLSIVPEYYTSTADGTGKRTKGGYHAYFIDEYANPGPAEADDAATTTVVGRDAFQQTADGEIIWVNYGELVMRKPDPWGQSKDFDVVSGRWDLWEDFESAWKRMCAVFDR